MLFYIERAHNVKSYCNFLLNIIFLKVDVEIKYIKRKVAEFCPNLTGEKSEAEFCKFALLLMVFALNQVHKLRPYA